MDDDELLAEVRQGNIPGLRIADDPLKPFAGIDRALRGEWRAPKPARRGMTLARALKEAAKAGNVSSVTIDNATFMIGEPGAAAGNGYDTVERELAEFEARHAKA
jgi:hypothetical protein